MNKMVITKSDVKGKKYSAIIYSPRGEKIKKYNFGASGYSDYTIHKDPQRKLRYIARHSKEDHTKINPGSLSRFILWNKETLESSAKDFGRRFNIKVELKI